MSVWRMLPHAIGVLCCNMIQPETNRRERINCSGPLVLCFGTDASIGPQLALEYAVRSCGMGYVTNAVSL